MTRIAQESAAEALQYGPTEGFERDRRLHRRGDGRRGDASRPRRRDRHHRRPAGDRPDQQDAGRSRRRGDLRGPHLPRRGAGLLQLPGRRRSRSSATSEGMRIDELERVLERLDVEGRRPKFIYSVPTFQNPAGVTMSLRAPAAPGRAGPRARAARRRGQPLRPAALRGRAAAAALPARRRRLRHLHRHLLEDPLARDPARLGGGAAAGDGEDRARQAGLRPLHLDPDPVLRPRVLRRGRWREYIESLGRALPRPPRRDARGAARATSRRRRAGPSPRAASSSGRPCPTTSTPATCWPRRCARTSPSSPVRPPTSTAAAATRCGSTSPAATRSEIREGIRRIGKVIEEQVELYGDAHRQSEPA